MSNKVCLAVGTIKKEWLTLVPATRRINVHKEGQVLSPTDLDLGAINLPTGGTAHFHLSQQYQPDPAKPMPWTAGFWVVNGRFTEKEGEANMKIKVEAFNVKVGEVDVSFKLPLMTNCVSVSNGAELMMYKPKAQEPKAKAVAVSNDDPRPKKAARKS
jgi:hypothetical protein